MAERSNRTTNERIGKITRARITIDRGCFLSFWLDFEFGGSGQAFGGFALCEPDGKRGRRGTAMGADAIRKLMDLFDVEDFTDIAGHYAVVISDTPFGAIRGIRRLDCDGGRSFIMRDHCADFGIEALGRWPGGDR